MQQGRKDSNAEQHLPFLHFRRSYASHLPADMLSGVSSKFFSTSLHSSLHSSHSDMAPSPFHHAIPNLRQLAQSVQLAQMNAAKNTVPASPTLAKLMKADEEKAFARTGAEEREILERDEVGWLMPPPPRDAISGVDFPAGPVNGFRRPASNGLSASGAQNGQLSSRNVFKAREVQIGQKRNVSLMNGQTAAVKKTSAFMASKPSNAIAGPGFGSMASEGARLSKRKPASPKRSIASRTLVLATPAKHRESGNSR